MYPENILKSLRNHEGLEEDDASHDEELNALDPMEAFEYCLEWDGIHGFGPHIVSMIEDIFGVDLTKCGPRT